MVILLAEDDLGIQFFIWKLLRAEGFTVLKAGDGEAALQASRNYPGTVDLLLTDMDMPRMNGLDLCTAIAAERPGIKVLTMSADYLWKERAVDTGLSFLEKPFSYAALRGAIQAEVGDYAVLSA